MKNGMAALLVAGLVGWAATAWGGGPLCAKPKQVGRPPERFARTATLANRAIVD
jgi:hypothetical protein